MSVNAEVLMQNKTNRWVVLAIYISIFINSFVFFQQPFEFYVGYLIYLVLLPTFFRKHPYNKYLLGVFGILLINGLFNIFLGNNTYGQFFKVFTGLFMSYLFYYYVVQEFKDQLEQLFKWYLYGCYIAAVIGLVQFVSYHIGFKPGYNFRWILNKWGVITGGNFGIRVNSIFGEPTYLGTVLSAAFFVSVYNLTRREPYYLTRLQSAVIVIVYFLSFSGLGQVGIFLTLVFLAINFGLIRYVFIAIPVGIILFNVMYTNVRDFRDRYDGLISLFSGEEFKLGKTHGSSFTLYNNYNVATKNFMNNPLFGTGIGSHVTAYDRYTESRKIKVHGFNLNSADANSMLLRLISETGLFGVLIFLVIIITCYVKRDPDNESYHWMVSNGILIMIMLNLFRQGHYFLNGFPFFVILYVVNSFDYLRHIGRSSDVEVNSPDPDLSSS
jgi:hypothetical protein